MKQFTIGYIEHDSVVYDNYLGPSMNNLIGEFDVIHTSNVNFPAKNYNGIISKCNTEYLILTHQDVTFSSDLLHKLQITIQKIPNFGVIGMVGVDNRGNYFWSDESRIYELDTLDCCFIVIKPEHNILFDYTIFNDYHLYVEDYCATIRHMLGKNIYTILVTSKEAIVSKTYNTIVNESVSFLNHHSYTLNQRGSCWGNYHEYKQKLLLKWPNIHTT